MNEKKTIVFLHGWGATAKIFEPIFYHLKDEFNVHSFDLPGFGSAPIERAMVLKDYVEFVRNFLKEKNIEKPIIVGHSFGGAIAVKFAITHPESISKLILVSASAIRKLRFRMILIKKSADFFKSLLPQKLRKFILKLLNLEKTDYAQIKNSELKETFKNIISEDLSEKLFLIKTLTLVIWGDKDIITPLKEGELIARLIPNAKLAVIKNTGHFLFLEQPKEFIQLIKEFSS